METKIIKINENKIDPDRIRAAAEVIKGGGLVAFPTETVYGLGASALDGDAAAKIYAAKGRPSDNPLIVHIAAKENIEKYARNISDTARKLIDAFMPGPFTIILEKKDIIPDTVTAGMNTVGLRCPINAVANALIKTAAVAIAAPSANISGKPSPTEGRHVIHDMKGRIDCIIDGGSCEVGVESTIVDATGEIPVLLRPGGITVGMLRSICPELEIDKNVSVPLNENEHPKCPGMKYKHYSPDAEVIVVEGSKDNVTAKIKELLAADMSITSGVITIYGANYDNAVMIDGGKDNREYAKNLFAALRSFDDLRVKRIFAEFHDGDEFALAVKNRLYRAAGYNILHVGN